jgi:predicted NAD-dependent protein-ADP-ribosyltransferase YbiA (DUF1768 family)
LCWALREQDVLTLSYQAEEVLYLKFRQHPDLCGLLIGTMDAELIYSEPSEYFWGAGETGGRNELGRALMRVRDQILYEGPLVGQ